MFYLYCKNKKEVKPAWIPFSTKVFKKWKPYFKIAIPSLLVYIIIFGLNAISLVVLGFVSLEEQAILGVLLNFDSVTQSLFVGVGYGIFSYLANFMGAGRIRNAKQVVYAGIIVWIVIYVSQASLKIIFRYPIAEVFFSTSYEIDTMAFYIIIMEINFFLVGNTSILFALFRAMAKPDSVTLVIVVITLLIGLPGVFILTLSFGFDLGMSGIWTNLLVTNGLTNLAILAILFQLNMKKISISIQKRMKLTKEFLNIDQ